jgi:glycosyltransferase involved in cell wall biosynthesis
VFSVIIPAHNEEAVIGRCLRALVEGSASPDELEIVVVCNGCTDGTAAAARQVSGPIRVVETTVPSKTNALNLGDEFATRFPRLYVDADVVLSLEGAREIARVLSDGAALAAAPAVDTLFPPHTSWAVRAYYEFWMALPYTREGMMAAGVYAVSRDGRRRFDQFPDVIADDGYFRAQFSQSERIEVRSAVSRVSAPATVRDLVRIKSRSRLGFYQLRTRFPGIFTREAKTKQYGRALTYVLARPRLWPRALPYLYVNAVSRLRAGRQARSISGYTWERDDSSRTTDPRRVAASNI